MGLSGGVELPRVVMNLQDRPDGSLILSHAEPLQDFDPNLLRCFDANVEKHPEKTLFAERKREPDGRLGDWQHLSFAEAKANVESIGQWLLDQGCGNRDTILVISGNSSANAVLRLGAMAAGVTSCPIPENYALMGGSFERLKYVVDLVKPKIIFAEAGGIFDDALRACNPEDKIIISRTPELLSVDAIPFDQLLATQAGDEVRKSIEHADPDAHAFYLLTSGSTGRPKAVIQTQRMLSTNLHQSFQALGRVSGWDEVMLDWLPWSHVSGAFSMLAAITLGGTLYIDAGKPLPGLFDETLRNLREIAVPYLSNVPAGFAMLTNALEADEKLRKRFFSKIRMLLYGGAGLAQNVLDSLQRMAIQETGHPVFITTGYGLTETACGCMAILHETDKVGIGLPLPGLEVKLVPTQDRYGVRLRGGNITPGYLSNPEGTAAAFDDEGFFKTGDTAKFHDPEDICQGMYFTGRLVEEFKLASGTWVQTGQIRTAVLEALAPALGDLLLCGLNRGYLAILGVPNPAGLGKLDGDAGKDIAELMQSPAVLAYVRQKLEAYNAANPGNSRRIGRFAFMREMPSSTRNEISDKGTLNQLATAENRQAEIEALYAPKPGSEVLVL